MSGQLYSPAALPPREMPAGNHQWFHFQSGRFWQDKNPLLMPGIELQFVGCPPHSLFKIPTEQSRFPHKQNFQHIAFLRFYTREYYRESSRVRSRRTFERCMKFHVYAHRQITHGRSDFTPDLDACACLVPGTVDTTTNWAVTTNWPNTIPIHPPGRSWMVCVCVVRACAERWVARSFRAAGSKVRHDEYFNPYRTNVELISTALSVVPGPMSSSHRPVILQCFYVGLPSAAATYWPILNF